MVAVSWDCDTRLFTSLYQGGTSFDLDLGAVDCELNHVCCPSSWRGGETSMKDDPGGALGAHGGAE